MLNQASMYRICHSATGRQGVQGIQGSQTARVRPLRQSGGGLYGDRTARPCLYQSGLHPSTKKVAVVSAGNAREYVLSTATLFVEGVLDKFSHPSMAFPDWPPASSRRPCATGLPRPAPTCAHLHPSLYPPPPHVARVHPRLSGHPFPHP